MVKLEVIPLEEVISALETHLMQNRVLHGKSNMRRDHKRSYDFKIEGGKLVVTVITVVPT